MNAFTMQSQVEPVLMTHWDEVQCLSFTDNRKSGWSFINCWILRARIRKCVFIFKMCPFHRMMIRHSSDGRWWSLFRFKKEVESMIWSERSKIVNASDLNVFTAYNLFDWNPSHAVHLINIVRGGRVQIDCDDDAVTVERSEINLCVATPCMRISNNTMKSINWYRWCKFSCNLELHASIYFIQLLRLASIALFFIVFKLFSGIAKLPL